jgi:mono/diheme cytochrome c family protein
MKKRAIFLSLLAIGFLLSACYYDKEEALYGIGTTACDTTAVTYSGTIAPIMSANCNSCHSASTASAGVVTSTYASLKVIAINGTLYHSVNWDSGLSQMPKGGAQLPTCDLAKIKKWINLGAPNN